MKNSPVLADIRGRKSADALVGRIESGDELIETMEDLSSPVGAFVRECCEIGVGYEVEERVSMGRRLEAR